MQILVVVANIQMRTLKTEVGKGSARTAIGRGLVGPKAKVKTDQAWRSCFSAAERESG